MADSEAREKFDETCILKRGVETEVMVWDWKGCSGKASPPCLSVMQFTFIKLLEGQLLKQNIDFQSGPCLT